MIEHRPKWTGTWSVRLSDAADHDIVCQEEQPEALLPFNGWRRKIVFLADLPGVGAAHFKIHPVETMKTTPPSPAERPAVSIPRMVVSKDSGDSWGTGLRDSGAEAGIFVSSGPARVVEQGTVRIITESDWRCFGSRIVFQTIAYEDWPAVELRLRIFWNEERKRLILEFPIAFSADSVLCEIPGGAIRRPADGNIHVHGRWCAIAGPTGESGAFGIAHGGLHGIEARNGKIRLSVLRSAAYCHERGFELDPGRAFKFSDQGVHDVRLALVSGKKDRVLRLLPGLADWLASPPAVYAHLPFGGPKKRGGRMKGDFLSIKPAHIRLLSCRPSSDGKALIIRAQESSGFSAVASFGASVRFKSRFRPFEIKTFRIARSGRVRETDLLEVES